MLVLIQLILLNSISLIHLGGYLSFLCEDFFHLFNMLLKQLLLLAGLHFEILIVPVLVLHLIHQLSNFCLEFIDKYLILHLQSIQFILKPTLLLILGVNR